MTNDDDTDGSRVLVHFECDFLHLVKSHFCSILFLLLSTRKRWLDVLKECADTNGYTPKIPPGGYSDPKTKFIFKHAIDALSSTGCVRHGKR
tara:strand:- start:7 stop:282 length:276 start_codon:yes stop_codon:yes gene_type:complete